jgi:hypothetical protein
MENKITIVTSKNVENPQETKQIIRKSKRVSSESSDSNSSNEDDFYDALEVMTERMFQPAPQTIAASFRQSVRPDQLQTTEETKEVFVEFEDEQEEPLERDTLPWLKDPNMKISIWAILKDNIGKDISKISVPVFFNDPTSLL